MNNQRYIKLSSLMTKTIFLPEDLYLRDSEGFDLLHMNGNVSLFLKCKRMLKGVVHWVYESYHNHSDLQELSENIPDEISDLFFINTTDKAVFSQAKILKKLGYTLKAGREYWKPPVAKNPAHAIIEDIRMILKENISDMHPEFLETLSEDIYLIVSTNTTRKQMKEELIAKVKHESE